MNYHDIKTDNMDNGDGLRVVIWLSGCDHHCPGCQNPETWNPDNGKLFGEEQMEYILNELAKDHISGITFTGGDPLHSNNRDDVYNISKLIKSKFPDKTIWLYTGYTIIKAMALNILHKDFLSCLDVIVDGRFYEELKDTSLMWRGSLNQCVIDLNKLAHFNDNGIQKFESHIPLEDQVEKNFSIIKLIMHYSK